MNTRNATEHASSTPTASDPDKAQRLANVGTKDTSDPAHLLKAIEERGTRTVGSYPPNRFGLYDTVGNVWEWCNDYFNPVGTPQPAANPSGPLRGVGRVIRGGSFVATTGSWARGYRSSIEPAHRSRFTGFRVARSVRGEPVSPPASDEEFFKPYNSAPPGYETSTGTLSSLVKGSGGPIATKEQWTARRQELRAKWKKLLGSPAIAPPPPTVRLIDTIQEQNYTGKLMYLQTEADSWEKIYVMMPQARSPKPVPVVIVPYYDVDTPAGRF